MPHSSCGSHVESSTTRCSATFAVATTAMPAERTNPGPRPAAVGRARPTPGACDAGPLRAACAPANRSRGTGRHGRRTSPSHREGAGITWSAGWFRGTRGAAGPGHPGGDRPRMPTFRSGPQGEKPAVRRTARPRNGMHPVPTPGGGSRPRGAAGPLSHLLRDTGTTGHGPIRRPRAADLAVPDEGV